MSSLQILIERDAFRLGEPNQTAEFTKLYWGVYCRYMSLHFIS
jgi:hypothetical protein